MTRLQEALAALDHATRLLAQEDEDFHGESYAVADALSLTMDAASQTRAAIAEDLDRKAA